MPLAAWLKALWARWFAAGRPTTPSGQSRSRNEAAATLAFAFRELLKHSGEKGLAGVYSELGWAIGQALSTFALEAGSTSAFLEKPLSGCFGNPSRCAELVKKIDDPVITKLWEIATLRALSDLLVHLLLRQRKPGYLLWNTADHVKMKHGIDLYEINEAYLAWVAHKA